MYISYVNCINLKETAQLQLQILTEGLFNRFRYIVGNLKS